MHATTKESESRAQGRTTVVAHGPGEGEAIWFLDNLMTVKASARDGARFGLVENRLPAGSCTPMHRHDDDDESFYVLAGTLTFFLEGGRTFEAGPGAFLRVPHGVAHGFRARTEATMLVFSDPAGFPEFVRDVGVEAPRPELPPAVPPDLPRLAAIAMKHGLEILGPAPE